MNLARTTCPRRFAWMLAGIARAARCGTGAALVTGGAALVTGGAALVTGGAALLTGGAALLTASPASAQLELHGRYIGSFTRTEGTNFDSDAMQHQFDIGTRSVTPGGLDLTLRTTLQYRSRLDQGNASLFRSRFFGDLRSQIWRLHGQFVPWQDVSPGPGGARARDAQIGLDLTPRNLPDLELNYTRRDRLTSFGSSSSEDWRAELSHRVSNIGTSLRFRRIDARSQAANALTSTTEEWRGTLDAGGSWRNLSGRADYEGLFTDFRSRDRRRDLNTHRVNLYGALHVTRRFTLSGTALQRWGEIDDNALALPTDVNERNLIASAQYRPFNPLTLEFLREYRRRRTGVGDVVSDFWRFKTDFRREIVRRTIFQTGFARTQNLLRFSEEIPNNTAYVFIDGPLRRGISGRAELRAATSAGLISRGTQWRRQLQLRTLPTPTTRLDVTWYMDTLPEVNGVAQRDRLWELNLGYQPIPAISLVGSWRWLDGTGRIRRGERLTSLNASWQTVQRVTLGGNWSRRRSTLGLNESLETVMGLDLTFWLPGEYKTQASWQRISGALRNRAQYYTATITKNF